MGTEEPRHRCRIRCLCVVCAMSLEIPAGVPLGGRLEGYRAAAVTTWGLAGHINRGLVRRVLPCMVPLKSAAVRTNEIDGGDEVRLCFDWKHAGSCGVVLQRLLSGIRTRRLKTIKKISVSSRGRFTANREGVRRTGTIRATFQGD